MLRDQKTKDSYNNIKFISPNLCYDAVMGYPTDVPWTNYDVLKRFPQQSHKARVILKHV
jgi:hypothetical protein